MTAARLALVCLGLIGPSHSAPMPNAAFTDRSPAIGPYDMGLLHERQISVIGSTLLTTTLLLGSSTFDSASQPTDSVTSSFTVLSGTDSVAVPTITVTVAVSTVTITADASSTADADATSSFGDTASATSSDLFGTVDPIDTTFTDGATTTFSATESSATDSESFSASFSFDSTASDTATPTDSFATDTATSTFSVSFESSTFTFASSTFSSDTGFSTSTSGDDNVGGLSSSAATTINLGTATGEPISASATSASFISSSSFSASSTFSPTASADDDLPTNASEIQEQLTATI